MQKESETVQPKIKVTHPNSKYCVMMRYKGHAAYIYVDTQDEIEGATELLKNRAKLRFQEGFSVV
jgi:hypothetical protein